jgi:hypothetical protein
MFKVLIDTCVWLDLAKDPKQIAIADAIQQMVNHQLIELVVPSIVLEEFRKNKDRIAKESAKSLSAHFKVVREAVGRAGGRSRTLKTVLTHLSEVNHKVPLIGGAVEGALNNIEKLLTRQTPVEPNDAIKLRATERAMTWKAPCHQNKNSIKDAIIIETYQELLKENLPGTRYIFVTHNKHDFSVPNGNHNEPHPDLKHMFSRVKSLYFISLIHALKRIDTHALSDILFDLDFEFEPRTLKEMSEAEELLFYQVWYNRHMNLRYRIETGEMKIVDEYDQKTHQTTITRKVLEGAMAAAERTEKRLERTSLDLGMILNGE